MKTKTKLSETVSADVFEKSIALEATTPAGARLRTAVMFLEAEPSDRIMDALMGAFELGQRAERRRVKEDMRAFLEKWGVSSD